MNDDFFPKDIMFLVNDLYPECVTKEQKEEKCFEIFTENAISDDLHLSNINKEFPFPSSVLIKLGKLRNAEDIRTMSYNLYSKTSKETTEDQVLVILEELIKEVE